MTEKELHEKAVRLCEGGTVEVNGHFVKAVVVNGIGVECDVCEMDSICRMDMVDLCCECDAYDRKCHILKLACQ